MAGTRTGQVHVMANAEYSIQVWRPNMEYAKVRIVDGQPVKLSSKIIDQSTLTADCWLVQFEGLAACSTCEVRNTPDCGGGVTLDNMRLSAIT
uniref:Uncharacterized protein n=1 Tax=viral metagenome TaxID=1070528 RepID=A0A6M3K4U1_9ZZZZ